MSPLARPTRARCNAAPDGKALTAFGDFQKVGMDSINQWNDLQSLCRAILRQDASRLQADLNCDLGITPLTAHRFLQKVRKSLQQFEMALAPEVIKDLRRQTLKGSSPR